MTNAIGSAIPKSLLKCTRRTSEREKRREKNQFAKPQKQEEFDFEMPSMPQQGFEEYGEDGVHSGELAAVNDDFADLDTNADDIVKKDGVSIFKVIETRYKNQPTLDFLKGRKRKQRK